MYSFLFLFAPAEEKTAVRTQEEQMVKIMSISRHFDQILIKFTSL